MVIPEERFPKRTEERVVDFPIPPTAEDTVEVDIADVDRGLFYCCGGFCSTG